MTEQVAAQLREVAALMRSRAREARMVDDGWWAAKVVRGALSYSSGEHVAGMAPAVGRAVADWLDSTAETHESDLSDYCGPVCADDSWWCAAVNDALAVARSYLGERAA